MKSNLATPRTLPLVAALLGAASVLGFAPFVWFPLPILSLALLFSLLRDQNPRQAFIAGWCYGLGLFLVGVSWVHISLSTYGGMPEVLAALATLLFCMAVALFPGLGLWLGARLAGPGWVRMSLALPVGWTLLEWTRGWLFTGFPWLALGYSQVPHSPLLGYAPVFGVYGVGLLAALSAGALATPRIRALILLGMIWLGGWALNGIHWTHPVGEPVKIALIQGNVAQELKFRPDQSVDILRDYARAVLASDARLIVLPETALPMLRSQLPPDYLVLLGDHARRNGGDVVLGVPVGESGERYYNSVISVGSSPEASYRKVHLVPFGEFFPAGFAWVTSLLSIPLSDFSAGETDQPPMAVAGQRLAMNICYEDVFGEERIAAARDATLLVNVSNDAWFGRSLAARQHLQIGAMRSLEAGRWQLRANNTGYTALIDNHGRVRNLIPPFKQSSLEAKVQGMTGVTPYQRWGNWPVLAGLLLLAGVAWRWAQIIPQPKTRRS